jgi:hypothetical protein
MSHSGNGGICAAGANNAASESTGESVAGCGTPSVDIPPTPISSSSSLLPATSQFVERYVNEVASVVDRIERSHGRFVEKVEIGYKTVSPDRALEKACQGLREKKQLPPKTILPAPLSNKRKRSKVKASVPPAYRRLAEYNQWLKQRTKTETTTWKSPRKTLDHGKESTEKSEWKIPKKAHARHDESKETPGWKIPKKARKRQNGLVTPDRKVASKTQEPVVGGPMHGSGFGASPRPFDGYGPWQPMSVYSTMGAFGIGSPAGAQSAVFPPVTPTAGSHEHYQVQIPQMPQYPYWLFPPRAGAQSAVFPPVTPTAGSHEHYQMQIPQMPQYPYWLFPPRAGAQSAVFPPVTPTAGSHEHYQMQIPQMPQYPYWLFPPPPPQYQAYLPYQQPPPLPPPPQVQTPCPQNQAPQIDLSANQCYHDEPLPIEPLNGAYHDEPLPNEPLKDELVTFDEFDEEEEEETRGITVPYLAMYVEEDFRAPSPVAQVKPVKEVFRAPSPVAQVKPVKEYFRSPSPVAPVKPVTWPGEKFVSRRVAMYFQVDGAVEPELYDGTVTEYFPAEENVDVGDLWRILYDDQEKEFFRKKDLDEGLRLCAERKSLAAAEKLLSTRTNMRKSKAKAYNTIALACNTILGKKQDDEPGAEATEQKKVLTFKKSEARLGDELRFVAIKVDELRDTDVLLGCRKRSSLAGNKNYHSLISRFQDEYDRFHGDKSDVAREVIRTIARFIPSGRFVEKDRRGLMFTVSPEQAVKAIRTSFEYHQSDKIADLPLSAGVGASVYSECTAKEDEGAAVHDDPVHVTPSPAASVNRPGEMFVNRRVAKYFRVAGKVKWGIYYASVTKYFPAEENESNADLWHIIYDDKDEEHFTKDELDMCLKLYGEQKSPPKAPKATGPSNLVPDQALSSVVPKVEVAKKPKGGYLWSQNPSRSKRRQENKQDEVAVATPRKRRR